MTLLYYDRCFLRHDTGAHPECADRLRRIAERLEESGLDGRCQHPTWEPVPRRRLARIHWPGYIDQVRALAESGGGELDADTVVSMASYEVALQAAGAVCDAVQRVVRGEDTTALCLVRPPGHHALARRAMGFCLFNNVAVAARMAIEELGLERVLIVDWDVHHGNGTQAVFWEDPRVGFLSIHRWPFYPGTGLEDETGAGAGLGYTLNLPVAYGTPRAEYLARFTRALERFADRVKPELVLVSAGFDAHRLDPIGDLGLEVEDFAALTSRALEVAEVHASGRLVSVLEGGYHLQAIAEGVEAHLAEMLEHTARRQARTPPAKRQE